MLDHWLEELVYDPRSHTLLVEWGLASDKNVELSNLKFKIKIRGKKKYE